MLAAGGGIALLTLGDGAAEPLDAVGVAFALVSAVCWAGYILLTKRVGARWAGLEALSVSLVVAALVALPAGIAGAGGELLSLELIVVGIGLALLVLLPYVFELIALRRLPTALFGVIMSLEPAIAALLGFLILDQELNTTGIVAIAMVSIASGHVVVLDRDLAVLAWVDRQDAMTAVVGDAGVGADAERAADAAEGVAPLAGLGQQRRDPPRCVAS